MWQRDFPGVYAALNADWSENVGDIMQALLGELHSAWVIWCNCIKLPELKNYGIMDVCHYITQTTNCVAGRNAFFSASHTVDLIGMGKDSSSLLLVGSETPSIFVQQHIPVLMQVITL